MRLGRGFLIMLVAVAGCENKNKPSEKGPIAPPTATKTQAADAAPAPAATKTYGCDFANDCTVSCELPNNCCGQACGCTRVYNVAELAEIKKANKATCDRPDCPKVDCNELKSKTGAACRDNRCVAVDMPLPTQCKTDNDCVVSCEIPGDCCGQVCGPCRQAYHRADVATLQAITDRACKNRKCTRPVMCAKSRYNAVPLCRNGSCRAKMVKAF